ncbi:hypothetical protein [Phenylobacterium montanum]|uniref:Uncharacterized protein n=1 Tax=Phenylobacterium montanum TaxID=2823693 RepID=A0A975G188_9CAUL|nr:hypothetical protein [Caulobacter sp. S6]QUD88106.1 hypothetical protein KCG34_24265 [Caulobacter sp. S6]
MDSAQNRRLWLTLGGGVAVLVISLALAFVILGREHASKAPPPASTGGLVVQMGHPDDTKPDPKAPLRCFVGGLFVGMSTLADCAKRNGVATDALDVGVDSSGALAAASQAGTNLTPLPPSGAPAEQSQAAADAANFATLKTASGDCLRYASGEWRRVGDALSLGACVQTLFAGHCEKLGGASYGRWMGQTLRLSPHHVEISSDNKTFRPLADQSDTTCAIGEF